ncbi:hypothetical protein [Sphingomonas sp.]|uniref:hypothetical protein n=1 Tax=Sphingomonas sp. TaxID=28214 RepID=UPI00289E2EC5|nr:hypothetical protein [Sphingomonas sp.]
MTDLTERLRAWAVRGKLLQPYEVKPLLREAATTLETLTQENARLREAIKPFVRAAEPIIHDDKERWDPDKWYDRLNRLTVGQFYALHAASPPPPARKALGGGDE